MRGRRWQEPVTLAAAASVVVVCAGVPLAALAAAGVGGRAVALLSSPATWSLLAWSIATSATVTVVALVIGVPLGVLLGRTDVAGRRVALLIHAFSTFVPPFLLALGWFHLLGRDGLVGGDATSRLLFAPTGDIVVQGLAFAPIVTVLTVLGVDAIDPSLEDAARLIARPDRVAIRILLPIAWPGIALAALVVFALAFSELGVPTFLRVRAYPAAVFARLGGVSYAPGEAFVLVLPQLAVALALLWLERRVGGRRAVSVLGLRRDRAPLRLGRSRLPLTVACWSVVLLGALPIVSLALRARGASWGELGSWVGASAGNGLVDAAIAATAITACGIVLGRGLARGQRVARAIDGLGVLAFVTAAGALGAGLIAAWSRPATQVVYASSAIVIIGYIARYGVLGVRPIAIAIARGSADLEAAAEITGAGYLRRLMRIVIPIHARAIAAAWLLALVFCLRDLDTAVLYYPPGGETLPVRIFTLEANGRPATVAALAMLQVAITAAVLALGLVVLRRRRST